jgi:hypothetical protein
VHYNIQHLVAQANLTVGKNWQQGVVTGQFNFPADELAYINAHSILSIISRCAAPRPA